MAITRQSEGDELGRYGAPKINHPSDLVFN